MRLGPYALRFERRGSRPSCSRRRGILCLVALVSVAASLAVVGAPAVDAASPNASASGSLSIAIRSITVSPTTFTLTCGGGNGALLFPNDHCSTPTFTLTNGAANALIDVSISNFRPTDNLTAWTPCGLFVVGSTPCTGSSNLAVPGHNDPGPNQFALSAGNGIGYSGTPGGDINTGFVPVSPGHSWIEGFDLWGPQSSTDQSVKWKLVVVWWAMPPS